METNRSVKFRIYNIKAIVLILSVLKQLLDHSDFNSEISLINLANLQQKIFSVGLHFSWIP